MSAILLQNVNFDSLKLTKIMFSSVSKQVVPVTVVPDKEMDRILFPYLHTTRRFHVECH